MQRVMIVGQPGSGKSTLARMIGAATDLPVVHMDVIHWKSGWVERDTEDRWTMVRDVYAQDQWVFEGGFSRSWGERATRADTLIWIDVGLWRRLWRVTYRFFRYFGQTRPDLPEGCEEGNWREMWAFYKWIWNTRNSARVKIKQLITAFEDDLDVVILKTIPEVQAYVEGLRARTARG